MIKETNKKLWEQLNALDKHISLKILSLQLSITYCQQDRKPYEHSIETP